MADAQVSEAIKFSVEPQAKEPMLSGGMTLFGGPSNYALGLPSIYDDRRQAALKLIARHPQNGLWPGALAKLAHKVCGISAEIKGKRRVKYYQDLIMFDADKGGGFAQFVTKVIRDWATYDDGAVVELIGRGDPSKPLKKEAITGIAVLDPRRCYFTGHNEFPVVYGDSKTGKFHKLHESRVHRFVDQPDSDPDLRGRGESALSRAFTWVLQHTTAQTYVGEMLDNTPPPGMILVNGILQTDFDKAWELYKTDLRNEGLSGYKPIVKLTSSTGERITVEFIQFARQPEGFDFIATMRLQAEGIALGLDVDPNDVLPQPGGTFGVNGQAVILDQKAKTGGFGNLLKMLERFYNDRVLPDPLVFEWKHRDADERAEQVAADKDHLEVATTFIDVALKLGNVNQGALADIVFGYLARTVEGLDLYDPNGELIRLYEDDPEPEQVDLETADSEAPNDTAEQAPGLPVASGQGAPAPSSGRRRFPALVLADTKALKRDKAFNPIADKFVEELGGSLIAPLQGRLRAARLGSYVREYLSKYGMQEVIAGKEAGGVVEEELTPEESKAYTAWLAEQNKFVDDLTKRAVSGIGESKRPMTDKEAWATAEAWATVGLQGAYYIGLASADRNGLYEFTGDDGAESCPTCKRLKGQKHRMAEWIKARLVPGVDTDNFECGGFHCKHKLSKVKGRPQGRLKGLKHEHAHPVSYANVLQKGLRRDYIH